MNTHRVVIMGVSGSGKSVVGEAVAAAIGAVFLEGDEYHSQANVGKMSKGIPLQDADRAGWLETLRAEINRFYVAGKPFVLSCSALKKSYRDLLRSGAPGLQFLYLHASKKALKLRLGSREGHYMPLSLLDSQLATLEPPVNEPGAHTIDAMASRDDVIRACLRILEEKHGN